MPTSPSSLITRPTTRIILLNGLAFIATMLATCYLVVAFTILKRQQAGGELFLSQAISEANHRIVAHDAKLDNFKVSFPRAIKSYELFVIAPYGRTVMLSSVSDKPISQPPNWSLRVGQSERILHHFSYFEAWSPLAGNYRLYARVQYNSLWQYCSHPVYLAPLLLALFLVLVLVRKLRQRRHSWQQLLAHLQHLSSDLQNGYQPLKLHLTDTNPDIRHLVELINRLAFKVSRYAKETSQQTLRQHALIDNAPVALFLINRRGKLLYFNEQFAHVFSTPFDSKVVYMLSDFITGEDKPTQQLLSQLQQHNLYVNVPVTDLQHENRFELRLNPLYNRLGQLKGFSGVLQVVTRYQAQLQQAWLEDRQKAEKLASFDKLWAVLGHELRTPLSGMIGMIELLVNEQPSLTAEQLDTVMTLQQSSHTLLQLLNDMLDMAKLDAGKLHSNITSVNLLQVLRQVSSLMIGNAQRNQVSLYIFDDPNIPWYFDSDDGRLRQILLNLMSNAIKFTKHGYVALIADKLDRSHEVIAQKFAERTAAGVDVPLHWLRLTVKDNGIGIHFKDQQKLFAYFNQANESISRQFGGTGLGLAISNNFTQLLGGFIHLKSDYGKGSEFQVYLPLTKFSIQSAFDFRLEYLKIFLVVICPYEVIYLFNRFLNYVNLPAVIVTELNEKSIRQVNGINFDGATPVFLVDNVGYESNPRFLDKLDRFDDAITILASIEPERLLPPEMVKRFEGFVQKPLLTSTLFAEISRLYHQRSLRSARAPQLSPEAAFRHFLKQPEVVKMLSETDPSDDYRTDNRDPQPHALLHGPKQVPVSPHTQPPTYLSDKCVLLAEDNPVNQKIAQKHLNKLGYEVMIANNGQEAIALLLLHRAKIGLILMDCHMPVLDGIEATRHIRANKDSIPIVALTANDTDDDRNACLKAGMDSFLTKPINRDGLAGVLNRYLL